MWRISLTSKYEIKLKRYQKKHPNELLAVLNNFDTYMQALNRNVKPRLIQAGWLHPEPHGVIAIDQKGGKGSLKQTRFYLFADDDEKIVYLLTIGDKNTQRNDIKDCNQFIKTIRGD